MGRKLGDKVDFAQEFWTWACLAMAIAFSVLIYFKDLYSLEKAADKPWEAYKNGQGPQQTQVESEVPTHGLSPTAQALVHSLDWMNEGDWKNRREAVNRLGWMLPSSQGEFDAITAHLKHSLDWRNEGDEDVRKAVMEALTNLDTNWKKIQAEKSK